VVHGVLDRIMLIVGAAKLGGDPGYTIAPSDEPTFFPG